jgi:peptidyl-prolyl cis-trans isomerase D
MMQTMRKHAKGAMAVVLFGLLIISFAIWGIGDIFRGDSGAPEVATVGDTEITVREFNDELQRELRRLESVFGRRLDPAQAREFGIVEQVLSGLITRALIDRAALDLSLTAGEGLIQRTILANPAFAGPNGQFDRDAFQRRLYNVGLSEAGYVAAIRGAIMRDQLTGSLTAGAVAPRLLLDDVYAYRRERRGGIAVTVEADSMTGIPDPTEAELAAFHTENANAFMAPDLRAVTAIVLSADEVAKTIAVPEEDIRAAYDDRNTEFVTPERRRFEQLLFLDEESANKAAGMLAQGRDFVDVATEVTGTPPIPLGPMTQVELTAQAPDLAEAGFALEADATSAPVRSALGWHILRAVAIEPRVVQPYDEVKARIADEIARERAVEEVYEIANGVDDALAGGATLEEAARELSLPLRTIPAIDTAGRDAEGEPIADLPQENGEFVGTVFDTAPGQQSLMVEVGADRYFVLRVDGETPAALRPLDTVRDKVEAAWRERKRQEAAEEAARALLDQAKAGGDLAVLAAEKGYSLRRIEPTVRTADDPAGGANEPVTATLFTLDPGQAAVTPAAGGYAVVRLDTVEAADPVADTETYDTLRGQLREQIANDIMSQFTQAVRERHPVSINQAAIENFIQ